MYKIAVLGDNDSVLGFKALGIDIFACDYISAKSILHDLAQKEYAIIYITEHLAKELKNEIDEYKDKLTPAIILIPSKDGSLGIGMDNVRICVERAVGADILDK